MKRYGILFAVTLIASVSILIAGQVAKNSIPKVELIRLDPISEEESVVCTGKVESISNGDVYAPANAIVKQVYVKEGDRVSAGQTLMTVSVSSAADGTQEAQETYGSYFSSSSASSAPFSSGDFSQQPQTAQVQTLTAPVSGSVSSLSVTGPGYYVDPSKPAVEIMDSAGLRIRLNVNESQVAGIQTGQKAEITGVGFKNTTYSGEVKEISSEAKELTTTAGQETVVEVLVSVDQPGGDIKPGFTAKAKIVTASDASVLVAPYGAVQADKDGNEYVLRVIGGKTAKTYIKTGREFNSGFEVKNGLSAGEWIVSDPESVQEGERVLATFRKAGPAA